MQILAGIILLGILIAFHELGHFLFAKWLGVRVLVFSVGFGPKLWGFKKGDTEYRLSMIPLGGYVRMFGESVDEELSEHEKKMSFMHQPIWRKSLIAFAGPLFNFILPIILFFFLLVGTEQVFAPRVGTLMKGGVAEKAGILPDDLIESVNNRPVKSFNEVADIVSHSPNTNLDIHIKRKGPTGEFLDLDISVKPEVKSSTNPLERDQSVGRIGIMPAIELPVVMVSEGPLKDAGLKSLDEIVEIDGKAIKSARELSLALRDFKAGSTLVIKRPIGTDANTEQLTIKAPGELTFHEAKQPLRIMENAESSNFKNSIEKTKEIIQEEQDLVKNSFGLSSAKGAINVLDKGSVADKLNLEVLDRIVSFDGEKLLSSVQLQQAIVHDPHAPHVLGVMKKNNTPMILVFTLPTNIADNISLNSDLLSLFGVAFPQVFKPGEVISRYVSPLEAIKRAFVQTGEIAWMTGRSLWLLVKREVPASQIGGPIMLFDVAQQAAQKGLPFYIFIMCLLSINLGLLNLLPIPALDGGHLLLFGIEAVQGKPLTSKTRAIATQIGIAILLLIMAFAIFNDLRRLFSGGK